MLKSMYSGISGMKANQTKMDVVGNNVANVGTTGFKKSNVRFADSLNQTMIYSTKPGANIGGVNIGQVGVGAKVSGIFKSATQGSLQPTGRPTDLAIDGDGFFEITLKDGSKAYTRDGSFNIDSNGDLVSADGSKVGDINIDLKTYTNFTISKDGEVVGIDKEGNENNIGTIPIVTFSNPEGLEAIGGNMYVTSANSGEALKDGQKGSVAQGYIEMSNVDLSEEFTDMIVTTRAFQAASKVITTSDELLQEIINLKR